VADVVVPQPGRILITGRSPGSTQLIAVTPTATKSYLITVAPSRAAAAIGSEAPLQPTEGVYEIRYLSETGQLQNAFDIFDRDGDRKSQLHIVNVHYFREPFAQARTSFPSVFYRVITPRREVTFLDDFVDVSPLTVASTQVRGLHWRDRRLELHGGYAAPSMYQDLFLPVDRRWVGGAGYSFRHRSLRITPTVYGFFSEPRNSTARRGVVTSIIADTRWEETFYARAEVGASKSSIGASGDLRYFTERNQGSLRVVYKPDDFPTLGLIDLRGLHGSGDWTSRATDRLTLTSFASYDRFTIGRAANRTAVADFELRYAIARYLSVLTGIQASEFRGPTVSLRSISFPVGLSFDTPRFGTSVTYRLIKNSGTNRRGDALRVTLRAGGPIFQGSLWAERQRQAPTLDLVFREEPGLELALLQLGISVRSPEDLARVLRDNAALLNLGYIEGVTVNLAPRRVLGGLDLGWLSPWNDTIRFHIIYDDEEGIRTQRETLIGTVEYSRRIGAGTDLYGSYTRWRTRFPPSLPDERSSFGVGARTGIRGLATLFHRGRPVEGFVFLDPAMTGSFSGIATPLEGIVIALDSTRRTRTDKGGRYLFRDVRPGPHRVAAELPPSKPAFFTTPSSIEVSGGDRADFGLVWSPARLSGRVTSDAKVGVADVSVMIASAPLRPQRISTDSEGDFAVNLPPGDYRVEPAIDSLPPGYELLDDGRTIHLEADKPQQLSFSLRALRSISGVVARGAEVEIAPLGRKTTADTSGNFVFRSLPAGTYTLIVRSRGHATSQTVTLPTGPASLHVGEQQATAVSLTPPPVEATGEFRVQVGAYRSVLNAQETREKLMRIGLQATVTESRGLHLVSVGPFPTRDEAERAARRAESVGLETYITPRTGEEYALQFGVFRQVANANDLVSRIHRLGMTAYTAVQNGLTIVFAGPFASRGEAAAAAQQAAQAGYAPLLIRR
jgi:cell division septation protein DedD